MLVDFEKNEIVDLLPDREASIIAAWLRDRPSVEIVARDRASAYADGVRQGAPDAIQVADRWHLLRNLGDAVQGLADRHSAAAHRAAEHVRLHLTETGSEAVTPVAATDPRRPTAAERASDASRLRRQSRFEEAARLHASGVPISRIAIELRAERKTVRRWLRLGQAPFWKQPMRGSLLDPFLGFLRRRRSDGCRNAAQLWRELSTLGFRGQATMVRHWAGARRRVAAEQETNTGRSASSPVWPAPRGYCLARLLMADTSLLSIEERLFRSQLLGDEPALGAAVEWAKRLNTMLRRKVTDDLHKVLPAASGTMLDRFAAGLRRDFAAINAALELPWTTSPVKGQVSRIKMLKRTRYGRAGFELLRAPTLDAA